jgi:hypothetical protein
VLTFVVEDQFAAAAGRDELVFPTRVGVQEGAVRVVALVRQLCKKRNGSCTSVTLIQTAAPRGTLCSHKRGDSIECISLSNTLNEHRINAFRANEILRKVVKLKQQ